MQSTTNMRRVHILVVEDEPFQQRMLRDVLKYLNFRGIMEADEGAAAISLLEEEQFDLILSDIEMPGMNGLELLRHIRIGKTQAPRDTSFIILTSHSDTEVLGAAMALDVNGFIVKPFKTGVILDKITRALNQKLILRSDTDYGSVVTDLTSLRRTRRSLELNRNELSAAAVVGARLQGQIGIPLAELRVGMRVAKNLTAIDGTVILTAETTLTAAIVNLLSDLKELVAGGLVTVYDPSSVSKVQQ